LVTNSGEVAANPDPKGERTMHEKVTIVGSGNVGATTAHWIASKGLADIVLIDVIEGVPEGKGLDLLEAMPIERRDVTVLGTESYTDTANSDIVVITAGVARKPGMSRDDLLNINYKIMQDVVGKVVPHSPNCILIIVSNPLDAMAHAAYKMSVFPRHRVIGMAGVLDSARFRTFVAQELKVSVEDVTAFVLGGHGDTMVPLPRYSTVAGIPITELLDAATIGRLVQRTRDGGAEIVKYLKTGSAYYAPGAAVAEMVEAILRDKKKILPCAAYLEGEYGIRGLFMGVPCKLGEGGIEQILEIKLTEQEQAEFEKSASAVRGLVTVIEAQMTPLWAELHC
jgi:malate dehydrogenase